MVTLGALWLPIVVSAVAVFVAGFLAWMVLPHHRSDWGQLPDEEGFANEVNRQSPMAPGQYSFPYAATAADWKAEAFAAKMKRGPVGFLVLRAAGNIGMGKSLAIQMVYCLLLSLMIAYVTGRCLPAGADYLDVFQVAGTVAILAHAGALPVNANWFGHSWSSTLKGIVDGIVYGLLTAGVFGWLWP